MTGRSIEILSDLIAFPTVSRDPNAALIRYIRARLEAVGINSVVIPNATGEKANLFATIGPADRAGVMLSGHTDVVPVDGQDWSFDPFKLTERGGKLYGRGTADMKGFVAAALGLAERAAAADLAIPLHLAFSYDEEVGCLGVPSLISHIQDGPIRPAFCIVGEPTGMAVATGHKGKTALRAVCTGREAHSALAPTGLNAIHLGADLVQAIRQEQDRLVAHGPRDGDYDVPYSTVHVGVIAGGVALNIVPNRSELTFESRTLAEDDPGEIHARIAAAAERIVARARAHAPEASIAIETLFAYPGLQTPPDAAIVDFVKGLTGANGTMKVAFGTEGGLFAERLGLPVVVCGPGSMSQGHKPDEYISRAQMARCDQMMEGLLERLRAGL